MTPDEETVIEAFLAKATLGKLLTQTEPPAIDPEDREAAEGVAHYILIESLKRDSENLGQVVSKALKYIYNLGFTASSNDPQIEAK